MASEDVNDVETADIHENSNPSSDVNEHETAYVPGNSIPSGDVNEYETADSPGNSNPSGDVNEHEATDVREDSDAPQKEGSENDLNGGEGKKWPGWPGENVFRMLVPVQKVGGIIGRRGEIVKKITEETKARIKILDGPPGTSERAVSCFSRVLYLIGFILALSAHCMSFHCLHQLFFKFPALMQEIYVCWFDCLFNMVLMMNCVVVVAKTCLVHVSCNVNDEILSSTKLGFDN